MDRLVASLRAVSAVPPHLALERLADIKSDHNNWLIPGRVMCGPYPGIDGINFDEKKASINLSNILKDGIDVFVCLQQELQSQDDSGPGFANHPYFPEFGNYAWLMRKHKLTKRPLSFFHFPVADGKVPGWKDFCRHITILIELIVQGRNLFIHCAGGHGRTGLYAACLLSALYSRIQDPEEILYFVQHAHNLRRAHDLKVASPVPCRSPGNKEQVAFFKEFHVFLSVLTKISSA